MKKLFLFTGILLAAGIFSAFTLCDGFIFFKEGASVGMTSYDAEGKVTGSFKTVYTKVSKTDSGQMVSATQEIFDKKGKSTSSGSYTIRCSHSTLYFDMKMMLGSQMQQNTFKDMEMTMEGSDMEMPSNLTVGNTLKDVNITFHYAPKGASAPIMSMTMKSYNRKVESKESVSTAAGTFECYKITEDVETKNSLFSMKMKSVSWFSKEAGTVKVESYKDNGKYMGKTELTELKK